MTTAGLSRQPPAVTARSHVVGTPGAHSGHRHMVGMATWHITVMFQTFLLQQFLPHAGGGGEQTAFLTARAFLPAAQISL